MTLSTSLGTRVATPLKYVFTTLLLMLAASAASAGEVTVSAAASLDNAFKAIAARYQALHPGARVRLNIGASGALLQQMARGAPVDVFAPADRETMDQAVAGNLVASTSRGDFAANTLVVAIPMDGKSPVRRLGDLAQAGFGRVAMGNPDSVPAGRYARTALAAAGLWPLPPATTIQTQTVRQALDYVARGEVDAAFVYATDAAIMKNKVKVAFEVPLASPVTYPIAPVRNSANPAEAKRFIAYVLSPAGQAILAAHGFRKAGGR